MKKIINENGSATIIAIIVAALVVGGGTVAYFATDGFGTNNNDEQIASENNDTNSEVSSNDVADESLSDNNQIPTGFPSDMPIYEPAEIITSREKDGGYRLGLQAKDASEDEVIKFYETELAKAGWSIDSNSALSSMLNISKGQWSGSITIHESTTTDIGTTISYIIDKN